MPTGGAPQGKDRTELWGWLGIVIGFCCCGILGIIFGVLSMQDAKKNGKSPVLGWIAIGVSALSLVINGITAATGNYPWMNKD